jgi:hypothetical protein
VEGMSEGVKRLSQDSWYLDPDLNMEPLNMTQECCALDIDIWLYVDIT